MRFWATACLLLGTAGHASHAQQPARPGVQITQPDATSLRLRINNPDQEAARLLVVRLGDNSWLLNETHREPAYGTQLEFNTLPSGRYAVLVMVGRARYRYTVQVDTKARSGTAIAVLETKSQRIESGLPTATF